MMVFMETMVLMPYGRVVSETNFIMIIGADGDDHVILVARVDELLQHLSDKRFAAVRAIVGDNVQIGARGLHLLLKNNNIFITEACNQIDFTAHFMQFLACG